MVLQNGRESFQGPVPGGGGGNGDDTIGRSTSTSSSSSIIMDTSNDMSTSPSSSPTEATVHPLGLVPPSPASVGGAGSGGGGVVSGSSSSSSSSSLSSIGSAERNSHEQPVIKRQRIDHDRDDGERAGRVGCHGSTSSTPSRSNGLATGTTTTTTTSTTASSSSGNSSNASSACSSSTSLSSSPSCSSTKLIPSSLEHSSDDEQQQQQQQQRQQQPASHHHLPPPLQHDTTPPNHHLPPHHLHHHHHQHQHQHQQQHLHHHLPVADDCHARFQDAIGRQCLCRLETGVLLACFKAYCTYEDATSESPATAVVLPLPEWPFEHLLRFLSNVQLLFDTYLKQNIKGNICAGVMELCNHLIRSDEHHQHHHLHHQHPHLLQHLHHLPASALAPLGGLAALDIDELIGMCSCSSKYLSYLAGRILSSFLIIVKDDPDDDRWLEKLVANLFDFGHLDLRAVRKISASLDVIKRIVEWKDETEHPLDEEIGGAAGDVGGASGGGGGGGGSGASSEWPGISGASGSSTALGAAATGGAYGVPPLAENYFAAHYQYGDGGAGGGGQVGGSIFHPAGAGPAGSSSTTSSSSSSTAGSPGSSKAPGAPQTPQTSAATTAAASSQGHLHHHHNHQHLPASITPPPPHPPPLPGQGAAAEGPPACRYVTLTDSESFDTTRIKFETINILGGKWSALVKHISSLIRAQANSSSAAVVIATETCILTFLRLWESIISVKANLSVVETQPFHSQLDSFQLLLLVTKNAVIYRQMLTLFNEALCYGSTLALQDLIPEEVGSLAHNIVRSVKDYRILDKMPKSSYSNHLGFLGYQGQTVRYQGRRLQRAPDAPTQLAAGATETCYDRTLLQKMALLVLKAVAVIVKEIRCDSSDSSVDSSDFDMQEIQMIERSIRDVVKKLETFLKAQLEFHPESHLSKVLIHLFDDQDDYLVEAMVCTLDVTSGISFRNNAFPELIAMLNPVYTFIEFSNLGPNITHLFLDLLISPETCFLLFLLRFLKYIRQNWSMFTESCYNYYRHNSYSNAATLLQNRVRAAAAAASTVAGGSSLVFPGGLLSGADVAGGGGGGSGAANANVILDSVMTVLISLRLQISRLVADTLFPYNITPILRLIENCESLYEGNELS